MMRMTVSVFAVIALMVVASTMLRSHVPTIELSAAAMPPLQELHSMAGVDKLAVQDVEDQSLVYPTVTKP
jgi:hypothetical protein